MTLTQQILAAAAGLSEVLPGQLISIPVDRILGNDITTPVAIEEFRKWGFGKVDDPAKITIVLDHFTPCKDIQSAKQCKLCREFAKKQKIEGLYDVGESGIEHALLPEQGLVLPGEIVIGADSHTCTYGALGCFSAGVGSTDMAAAMANGKFWLKVPEGIAVVLHGELPPDCTGKDVILTLIGMIGVDGATYKSLEFIGKGVHSLSMDDRFTIANMSVEAGAKNGIFMVDDQTHAYCRAHANRPYSWFEQLDYPEYSRKIDIDLTKIVPTVACPHLPSNVKPAAELADVEIQQAVIGSCTNGRLSDMAAAAEQLRGKHVAKGVRCIVIPATMQVWKDCLRLGYAEIFADAGCVFSTPTCGPCLGGHMGVLAPGETAISTTNRNFVGRMGDKTSKVYLASPAVAAASAVAGRIAAPRKGETK